MRLESTLRSVLWVALAALAGMSAQAQERKQKHAKVLASGNGWRLVDMDEGGGTGLNTRMWEVGQSGVAHLPVTQAEKDALHEAFADDPGSPDDVIFYSQALLAAQQRPDFPRGYEPYLERHVDADARASGGQAAPQATLSPCTWKNETRSGSWTFSERDLERDFDLSDGAEGTLRLSLPMTGQADVSVTLKKRKCAFGSSTFTTGFKLVQATAKGHADIAGTGSLNAAVSQTFPWSHEWKLAEPHLGSLTFTVSGAPVRVVFTLPVYAGTAFEARIAGTLSAQIDASGSGRFHYTCTRGDCSGSSTFDDPFELTAPTGSAEVDLAASVHARVMVRAALEDEDVGYVEGGLEAHAQARIWGYSGNTCGDADGDGQDESVEALAADLRWGYRFAYGMGGLLLPDELRLTGGSESSLGWRDLLGHGGSTALQPMLIGPSSAQQGEQVSYMVRMRPCYPYGEAVRFSVTPGDWSGSAAIASPPFGGPTVQGRFAAAGMQTLLVRATSDAAGRELGTSSSHPLAIAVAVPSAPTALATSVLGTSSVRLSWSDTSAFETGFEVQRRTLPQGVFAQLATVPANATAYTDSGLGPGSGYEYRLRARNTSLHSDWSNAASATTTDVPPAAPGALAATVLSTTSVRLRWTDASHNETGFELQRRRLPSAAFAPVASLAQGSTAYTDNAVGAGRAYEYRVRARNSGGSSPFSNVASATTVPPTPGSPANLAAAFNFATRAIRLTWTDTSSNEQGFELQSSFNGGAFADMSPATVGANVTLLVSAQNAPPGSYQFRVRSFNGGVSSSFSNVAALSVAPPPPGPGYRGCYSDSSTRALPVQLAGTTHTIESCRQAAHDAGYRYAGLQYYGYCFAGTAPGYTLVSDNECNTPCSANGAQMCGGAWHNSVYDTGYTSPTPPPPATRIAWIQPAESSWGPAGSLTAAGYATNGTGGVRLVWRERGAAGVWGPWTTVAWQPPPSPDTTWSNTIASGKPTDKCHWFDAYTSYAGATSPTFHYRGAPGCR